jgi:hypothetical protein
MRMINSDFKRSGNMNIYSDNLIMLSDNKLLTMDIADDILTATNHNSKISDITNSHGIPL